MFTLCFYCQVTVSVLVLIITPQIRNTHYFSINFKHKNLVILKKVDAMASIAFVCRQLETASDVQQSIYCLLTTQESCIAQIIALVSSHRSRRRRCRRSCNSQIKHASDQQCKPFQPKFICGQKPMQYR